MTKVAVCHWENPGADPFKGNYYSAVMSYTKIPFLVRFGLACRIALGSKEDDTPDITHNDIKSRRFVYLSGPNDMYFGRNSVCTTVVRDTWPLWKDESCRMWVSGRYAVGVADICGNPFWCDVLEPFNNELKAVPEPTTVGLVAFPLAFIIHRRMKNVRNMGQHDS